VCVRKIVVRVFLYAFNVRRRSNNFPIAAARRGGTFVKSKRRNVRVSRNATTGGGNNDEFAGRNKRDVIRHFPYGNKSVYPARETWPTSLPAISIRFL